VIIDGIQPAVDSGRFPIKRTVGEEVLVRVDMFADGHDLLAGVLRWRKTGPGDAARWNERPLVQDENDSWRGGFTVTELGEYEYTAEGWIDRFATWVKEVNAKFAAQQDVDSELREGADLVQAAVRRHPDRSDDDMRLLEFADKLRGTLPQAARVATAGDAELRALMAARPDRRASATFDPPRRVVVDPVLARFGAWYEMFPRSCTSDPGRGGTLREAEQRLPDLQAMGFDVVYLPPIHPIGTTNRKGRNNTLAAAAGDPGSPWAIGSDAGGHTAVDPGLGTLDDFDRFVSLARGLGLEVALDIAFQASPDHPWVREHPEWFRHRPDGSIKYAENPPKKYQDIYPFDFDSGAAAELWTALGEVFRFWIAHGVRTFRVDNPHTKSFRFWEWVIADVRRDHPEVIFLAEAFTRPKVMRYLAKIGFNQSYTYFTWRNSAWELREYLTELTTTELQEYMRPNLFANTPDILHEYLQAGGRPAFQVRLILAATLGASYGIYSGFELCENVPVRPGSEEYLHSEKYEIRPRRWDQPGSLRELIARVNEIRRQYPALQANGTLRFHDTDNPAFLFFSKTAPGLDAGADPPGPGGGSVFVVANTDPHWLQHGWVRMPIHQLGIPANHPYTVEDLLDSSRYTWRGEWNYVRLAPSERVAHIFVIREW
jgi:starch synthase (maltosyl-transferring)